MRVDGDAAVTFNGNFNVMKSNTAPINKGNSIYSQKYENDDRESTNIEFSVCIPGTPLPGTLVGNLELDFDVCLIELCKWHAETNKGVAADTSGSHDVPAIGCKMSKRIDVYGDMTINGVSGSYHELQSNRVDNQGVTPSHVHRHFNLKSGKLTLNYLKLTWGEAGGSRSKGGFIWMNSGTLAINWIHFDGKHKTSGTHANVGGCIYVNDGTVTIKESTFEGFRAAADGGAMYVDETSTSTPMTIESTTFKNNDATVRSILLCIN